MPSNWVEQQTESHHTDQNQWSNEVPILVRRWAQAIGFDPLKFSSHLDYSLKDLTDPFALKGMEKAVERLVEAFRLEEKICLYADFDMDGTPGLALLIQGLQLCGFKNLLSFQPNRFSDGYGVHTEIVEEFIERHGIDLFVTVDVGITAVEAVERANELGVDFIITDHHQAKEVLPQAYAIVNPNQPNCNARLEHLCGTGVAFYLVLALRKRLNEQGLLVKNFDPKVLLDCFAIGTISDMVPLIRENRALVQHGLLQLEKTPRFGVKELMEQLGLSGRRLFAADVGIQLSPKLNALGRMDSEVQALDIFLAKTPLEATQLVGETLKAQKDRTQIQEEGEKILFSRLESRQPEPFVFEHSQDFYKGIVGLLANKAVEATQTPSFIGSEIEGRIVGSARAPEGQSVLKALEFAGRHLVQFGGHHQAAGFEMEFEKVDGFRSALAEYFRENPVTKPVISYHCRAEIEELDLEFRNWLKRLEPFGMGFEPPIFRLDHIFVVKTKVLKDKHLKLTLKDINGQSLDALWFFADNIEEKKQLSGSRVSVIAQPSLNQYMGRESLQLFIKDLQVEYS